MASGKRTSLPRTGEHEFPALFTIDGSARHEILLINPGLSLADLTTHIESLLSSSPNAQEFMGKYRGKDVREAVREVTVKWATEGRDSRVWVRETLVTEENVEAVLRMMAVGVGRDVFDVKVKVVETKGEEGKGEGKKK